MDEGPYAKQWMDYQRRRVTSGLVGFGGLAAVVLILLLVSPEGRDRVGLIAAAVWMFLVLIARARFVYWPCPRCGNPFSYYPDKGFFEINNISFWVISKTGRCWNCDLPKYSRGDPDKA